MPTENCTVTFALRDPDGNIISNAGIMGTTDDGGATCTVPLGYTPMIAAAAPADITVTINPAAVDKTPASLDSSSDDYVGGTSVLHFTLPA